MAGLVNLKPDLANQPEEKEAGFHFSVQGTLPDYFATTTDEYGKFVASLPDRNGVQYYGNLMFSWKKALSATFPLKLQLFRGNM